MSALVLEQNSPEWLQMRKSKIGASDAPIIMGISPWKTAYRLWQEKLDLVELSPLNWAMQRGHDLEDEARKLANQITTIDFKPIVMIHREYPWMMASLDGFDESSESILEIKCPGLKSHQKYVDGELPEMYYAQIQHQLAVSGLSRAVFFSYHPDHTQKHAIICVCRNEDFISKMIEQELKFFDCMESFIAPELSDKDYEIKDDPLWYQAACEWRMASVRLKEAEELEAEIRKKLIFLSQNRNSVGCGVRLTKSHRKGSVDYSKIPEIQDLDLEKYRKPSIESFRISAC